MVTPLNQWYSSYPKKTFSECSKDYHDPNNIQYMTQSAVMAIDFDDVKDSFVSVSKLDSLKSNDALYYDSVKNVYYFIEFKNGEIKPSVKKDLQIKIYDSFIILDKYLSVPITNFKFKYILVYNANKCPSNYELKKSMANIQGETYLGFGLDKIKGSIFDFFDEMLTMNEKEFEKQFA